MNAFSAQALGIDVAEIESRLADNWSLPTRFFVAMEGDLMQLSTMHPVAADLTRHETHYLMAEGGDSEEIDRAIEVWDRTYGEDNAITAVQQGNLACGRQPWNRYVARREANAIHFSNHIWQRYKQALAA